MRSEKSARHDSLYFNVELAAPPELHDLVINLQPKLNLPENVYYLPGTVLCPVHLTLYSTFSSRKAIDLMIGALKQTVGKYEPIWVKIEGIGCFVDGSIYLKCERSAPLIMLHEEIVRILSPLRDVIHPPSELAGELTREQIERFIEVGDPFALDHFVPHVTIVSVDSYEKAMQLAGELPRVKVDVAFQEIAARIWRSLSPKSTTAVFKSLLRKAPGG